ncbi:N-acetyltransferase [Aureimonas sp. SA4125]|uniref:GNAT family N-acetyltransferase n=1 Tax=Aureimonas sp. SA4125 TaxID=2826993 RepID=UPI001CC69644|nr:GNAT family N-acetyltransferase [Aureimonas sp. SA4125]BDA83543.1 N-acetyltransferase [Aureimonas sp. SA4125]
MTAADLDGVKALSDRIHPGLVERREVFEDRLAVFPAGCLVLVAAGEIAGYGISHPAKLREPPHLDRLLGRLRPDADSYYIHDVALAPEQRGTGRAVEGVARLLAVAAAYPAAALVSVYGTAPFWARFGFDDTTATMPPGRLAPYGDDARYMIRKNSDFAGRSRDFALRRD